MIRGTLISLSVRMLDLPSRYGFHLLVAAALGVVDTGRFYIVFSIMVALAGFGRLGMDQALTRQLAMDIASGRPASVRPAIWGALRGVLLASIAVTAVFVGAALPFAQHVLHKGDLTVPLMLGALAVIPQNVGTVLAGALAGLQRVGQSQMVYSWLWPAIFCVIALGLTVTHQLTVAHALVLTAASFTLAAVVGAVLLKRALAVVERGQTLAPPAASLLRPGLSLFTLELTKLLITSAPAVVLGIVASDRQTGLFALTWRIALAINLLISGVTGMAMPRFAALHAGGDTQAMEKAAGQAIGLVLCLALPAVACMLIFPTHLLALFGHGFDDGAGTLRILAVGQLAAACFTAMPEMLGMTAHTNALYRINACSLLVLLIGLAALTPALGSEGAAVAISLALFINGAAAAWLASRLLGVSPLPRLWRESLGRLRHGLARGKGKAS